MTRAGDERQSGSVELDDTEPRGVSSLGVAVTTPGPRSGSAQGVPAAFGEGDLVAGRWRIVDFVAQGGMGEVYEADDLELKERVALKTVRTDIVNDASALERFRREIQLARKVTHPNVCRIFDVGYHDLPTGQRIPFLSMELLAGETLTDRIRRLGRLQPSDALPILRQMTAALDAAHRSGIVHRDFKSANVVIVGDGAAMRTVVTDFGLARIAVPTDPVAAAGITGMQIVGSPGYMSPEQVEGGEVRGTADLYSLGVVLYEMMTGHLPFVGETPMATAIKRLNETPLSPRVHVPDLDSDWETAILRCLARDPARRPQSGAEVLALVDREASAVYAPPPRSRRVGAIVVGVALGIGAIAALALRHPRPAATRGQEHAARRTVAVRGFKNLSGRGERAWISTALVEMLRSEMAAGDALRVVTEEETGPQGADYVVTGSYLAVGDDPDARLRIDVRLDDARSGETLTTMTEDGTGRDLIDVVTRSGQKLRGRLGIAPLSQDDTVATRQVLPRTPDAARLYTEGLAKLRMVEPQAARALLERAIAADPDHPLAHAALASAWKQLGYDARAEQEAKRALDLSDKLPRNDRLLVEARYHEMMRNWVKAAETYRTLRNALPDDVAYGEAYAQNLVRQGKPKEALGVIEELRRLPAPMRDDPTIDLTEARVANALSDYQRIVTASGRAVEKARAQGAHLLTARALALEGQALWDMGRQDDGDRLMEEARRLYGQGGDRGGVAEITNTIGAAYYNARGDRTRARREFESALAIQRDIGFRSAEAQTLMNLANVMADDGKLAEARDTYEQALLINHELGKHKGEALLLFNLSSVVQDLGDLPATRKYLEQSLAVARSSQNPQGEADAMYGLAGLDLLQDRLPQAQKDAEQAIALQEKLQIPVDVATSRLTLAEVTLEQGHPADALALARKSSSELAALKTDDRVAIADTTIARGLLALRRLDEAGTAIKRATGSPATQASRQIRINAVIAAARLKIASGDLAGAIIDLDKVLAEPAPLALHLEARLALAEARRSRAELRALEKEARGKGFALIARKAHNALEPH
jgi:tetratricopeptide (TPR) repeat protein/tRNA A-37 threonylcarbamoyl transferase component Bud32